MTRVGLSNRMTMSNADDVFLVGVTDIDVTVGPQGLLVCVSTRPGEGGVAVYEVTDSGSWGRIDQAYMPGVGVPGVISQMELMTLGGVSTLLTTGVDHTGLWALEMTASGQLDSAGQPIGTSALPGDLVQITRVEIESGGYVYGYRAGSNALEVWALDAEGRFAGQTTFPTGAGGAQARITDMTAVQVGEVSVLLAALDGDVALVSYILDAQGQPVEADQAAVAGGLGIACPTAVQAVELAGQTYVLLAASGSSSISVFALSAAGQLSAVDHVLDDLHTRFAGAAQLDLVRLGDHVFVAASGSDDGLSLFQLLPGGRLLHLDTMANRAGLTLENIAALELTAQGGQLQIYASGSTAGVSILKTDANLTGQLLQTGTENGALSAGAGYDVLVGNIGDDNLQAGSGGAVLMDGAGTDVLRGGSGRDLFVLDFDGDVDWVTDFDPAYDSVDLSGWQFLRSTMQLDIQPVSTGADIRFNGEVLHIRTANGQRLDVEDVLALDLLNISRLAPGWFAAEPGTEVEQPTSRFKGTGGVDQITGSTGADELIGLAADDALWGLTGNDSLDGGAGADYLNGGIGSDTYYIDNLGDRISESRRWEGIDHVYSSVSFEIGREHIENVTLMGSADINAIGNGLANTIRGNDGNNILDGKKQIDTMIGGDGNDLYVVSAPGEILIELENEGIDTVRAYRSWALADNLENLELRSANDFNGVGNNLDNIIVGSPGDNQLIGRAGNDVLRGQGGADTFIFDRAAGADNVDTILDFNSGEDLIKIKGNLFGGLSPGVLDADAFHLGLSAGAADDRLIYHRKSGQLWVDRDGTGAADQVLIMVLDNSEAINSNDLLIY